MYTILDNYKCHFDGPPCAVARGPEYFPMFPKHANLTKFASQGVSSGLIMLSESVARRISLYPSSAFLLAPFTILLASPMVSTC